MVGVRGVAGRSSRKKVESFLKFVLIRQLKLFSTLVTRVRGPLQEEVVAQETGHSNETIDQEWGWWCRKGE